MSRISDLFYTTFWQLELSSTGIDEQKSVNIFKDTKQSLKVDKRGGGLEIVFINVLYPDELRQNLVVVS